MTQPTSLPHKIGITGTIGAGKSWVGKILETQGIPVLDTDQVVATLYQEDNELKSRLTEAFGADILAASGSIDKAKLRHLVFGSPEKLKTLEKMVHPLVEKRIEAFLNAPQGGPPIKAVLIPLLFETGTESRYDEVWTVQAEEETLINRLIQRDRIDRTEAKKRLLKQWSQAKKAERAHRIIDNSGTPEATKAQVLKALNDIQRSF